MSRLNLLPLFLDVRQCTRCSPPLVLRDSNVNVPQPGWVGRRYRGLVFAGQNPGVRRDSSPQLTADEAYIRSLNGVRDVATLDHLHDTLRSSSEAFAYYRSFHFDVDMEEVAYINVVRCRTAENATPVKPVVSQCRAHFSRWLDALQPRGVVFLGVFAERSASDLLQKRRIDFVTISRQKSLTTRQRDVQMTSAKEFIASVLA